MGLILQLGVSKFQLGCTRGEWIVLKAEVICYNLGNSRSAAKFCFAYALAAGDLRSLGTEDLARGGTR